MLTNTTPSRIQRLLVTLFANPYESPDTPCQSVGDLHGDATFITSPRSDWLSIAALAVTVLSSVAIYLYHTGGTGVISDPVLLSLASKSVVWIPVYRMAMPLLILVMPNCCRRTYSVFFLVLGILCCLNDFPGHYYGTYLVNNSAGLYTALGLCFVLSFGQFAFDIFHATNRLRAISYSLGWLGVMLLIEASFYAVSVTT